MKNLNLKFRVAEGRSVCSEEVGEDGVAAVSGADVEYTEVVHPQPGDSAPGNLLTWTTHTPP